MQGAELGSSEEVNLHAEFLQLPAFVCVPVVMVLVLLVKVCVPLDPIGLEEMTVDVCLLCNAPLKELPQTRVLLTRGLRALHSPDSVSRVTSVMVLMSGVTSVMVLMSGVMSVMVLMSGVMSVMVLMSAVMVLMSGVMLVMVLMLTVQQVSFSDVSGVTLMTVEVMVVQTQSSKKGYLNQTKTIQKGMLSICPEIPLDCPGLYSS